MVAADDDLYLTITDIAAKRSYVYQAVADVNPMESTEVSAEPGVSGSIGPDLAARISITVECLTLDSVGTNPHPRRPVVTNGQVEMLNTTAVRQYQQLRALRRKPIRIASRSVPDVRKVWLIENVGAKDDLEDTNHFTVTLALIEIVGGADAIAGGGVKLALGTISIPPPPQSEVDSDGSQGSDPNVVTGSGKTECIPTFTDELIFSIGSGFTSTTSFNGGIFSGINSDFGRNAEGTGPTDSLDKLFKWIGDAATTPQVKRNLREVGEILTEDVTTLVPRCTL